MNGRPDTQVGRSDIRALKLRKGLNRKYRTEVGVSRGKMV